MTSSTRARIDGGIVGGVEIDDQLEVRRLLDRQIGQLLALENSCGVSPAQVKGGRWHWQPALTPVLPEMSIPDPARTNIF